jgi:hypothetical protein
MRKFYRYAIPAVAGIVILAATPIAMAASATTAQSVWAAFHAGNGVFGYTDKTTYTFDSQAAQASYTNALDTSVPPTVMCSGSAANCVSGNTPTQPPLAPAADTQPVTTLVNGDRCTFYTGGQLSSSVYTKSTTVNGSNGKGNWSYTWTYRVTGQVVPAETAWTSAEDSSDGAHVTLTGEVAGESVLSKGGSDRKYSFSLLDSAGVSRVTGLSITLTDPSGNSGTPTPVESTVVNAGDTANFHEFYVGTDAAAYPNDLHLDAQIATNGNAALLTTGDVRTILNADTFAGNNNGGADGSALAYAALAPTHVSLTEGDWTATLTGSVKDNTGTANTTISVDRHLVIIGLGNCKNA